MKLALKIDVATLRGTRDAVPRIAELLKRHDAGATFLFALGPDRSGLHGKLLPAPQLGRRCEAVMRAARAAGFEVGMHAWDARWWNAHVAHGAAQRTGWQMQLGAQRFLEVFGEAPRVHGAPGWHMNVHAFRRTQSMGFLYASDTVGTHPFIPVLRAEIFACPQFPTTLPTLDESPPEQVLQRSAAQRRDQVFTLRAESFREEAFAKLLAGWKEQGYQATSLATLVADSNLAALPLHEVTEIAAPGGRGRRATQGRPFLEEKPAP